MGLILIYYGMAVKRMGGNVRSECEEDEGTDYEDGDSDTDWCRWRESDIPSVLNVGSEQ